MPPWLNVVSWLSIALGIGTAAFIAADIARRPQPMKIMNIVWPVTGLYFPVIGFRLYTAIGRLMRPDAPTAEQSQSYWKSIFLSATHCAAGCVIGDIIGAPTIFATGWTLLGQRLYAEYATEFALAYSFGIAFQYFPIRAMRQVAPHEAVRDAVKADTLALTAFEIGLFAWMGVVYFVLMAPHPPEASTAIFWFMMQIGMVLGFLTTYPANWLLVRWGVKGRM